MALSISKQHLGATHPAAYVEVVAIVNTKQSGQCSIIGCIFTDDTKQYQIDQVQLMAEYTPDANVEWAYTQLKTLPEFAGAVDA